MDKILPIMLPRILAVSDLHANWEWFAWLVRHAHRFDMICLGGDMCHMSPQQMTRAEQRREVLRQISVIAASGIPIAVAEGNHDAVDPGWLGPGPGLDSVIWPGFSGGITVGGRRLILTLCPDTYFGSGDTDRVVSDLFRIGAEARDREGSPWLVAHHEPPDATPICVGMAGSSALNHLVLSHRPDLVLCGHNHEAPFEKHLGGDWHCRIGPTLLVNAGQWRKRRWPCHFLIEDDTVTWRAPGHPRESVRVTPGARPQGRGGRHAPPNG